MARPRGSMLATLSLLLGVASAGAVATGVLAVPGVAVGLFTTLLATVGIAATARPHVTGRISALFG
ncbi:MAG TPA: hypothetical protein VFE14_02050, partial [Micromonosporaceae bacterium]|nr:hypothetical protein [Micromonosporaceae bacterium]